MTTSPVTKLANALKAAGVAVEGVSPDATVPGGYRVFPASLQAAAQPIIDAFNPTDPAHESAELTTEITGLLDNARLTSAVVWVILRTMFPSDTVTQTKNKFNAPTVGARALIIDAFKTRPWL